MDGLNLTASACDCGSVCQQSWSQYLLLCRNHCILYQLHPSLLAVLGIVWCRVRTEAEALTIRLDATPSGLQVPHLHHPPFYAKCPFCHNPANLSWLGTGTKYCWLTYTAIILKYCVILKYILKWLIGV